MNQYIEYISINESYKKIATRETRMEKVTSQTYCLLHSFFFKQDTISVLKMTGTHHQDDGEKCLLSVLSAEIGFLANTASSALAHVVIQEMCLSQTQRKTNFFVSVESLGKNSYLK